LLYCLFIQACILSLPKMQYVKSSMMTREGTLHDNFMVILVALTNSSNLTTHLDKELLDNVMYRLLRT
ncbi:hypothetical protein DP181_20660, partial [Enterobacter kobei]